MANDITPVPASKDEAWDLVENARNKLDNLANVSEEALDALLKVQDKQCWIGMGYESWEELYTYEFEDQLKRLQNVKIKLETRLGLVQAMSDGGLSNRQIAATLGVSEMTVRRDLKTSNPLGATNVAPEGDETAGQSVPQWNDHGVGDQLAIDAGPSLVENLENDEDEEDARRKRREEWLNSISLDRMVIQTQTQEYMEKVDNEVLSPEPYVARPFYTVPEEEKPVFLRGQKLAPGAEIPEPRYERPSLPPPNYGHGQYVVSTRMIPDPVSEIPPPPEEPVSHRHCKTCACDLLP